MATSPASAAVQQYLTTTLFSRPPAALPYAHDARMVIIQHLSALSHTFPTLQLAVGPFTYNDGRTTMLLRAEGTISHASATFLPVSIWLLETYPRTPPAVFLSFPPRTAVRPRHPLVDPSGAVSIPYLLSWSFPYHNLVDLVRSLARLFGQDPPFVISPRASDDARTRETAKIVEAVRRDLAATKKNTAAETEALFTTQELLRKRNLDIGRGIEALEEEKEMLEQQLQIVRMNCDVVGSWVAETNRMRTRCPAAASVDQIFKPLNARERQAVECVAADMATEDAIDALDEALREGCVTLAAYMKSVRALSREQFFHRTLADKISGAEN